jgi:sugar phosphate isomerase/epimerase
MEINACWAERGLGATIAAGVDRIRLVQVSDYAVGTLTTPARLVPGDGDIPIARILGQIIDAGYRGCFDLELIGPAIEDEGYERAVPRAVTALDGLLAEVAPG